MSKDDNFLGCSQDVFHRNIQSGTRFCTRQNWQSSVLLLSQELEAFGYSSPCVKGKSEPGEGNLDVIAFVNTTWTLLQDYKSCLKMVEGNQDELRKINSDMEYLESNICKQKELLQLKERQAIEILEKERQSDLMANQYIQHVKNLKEEVRRLNTILTQRESRYHHDAKRKEQEVFQLKDKLTKLLGDKAGRSRAIMGIELSSGISKGKDKIRGKWLTDSSDSKIKGDLFHRLISEFEFRKKELMRENLELRQIIGDFSQLISGKNSDKCLNQTNLEFLEPKQLKDFLENITLAFLDSKSKEIQKYQTSTSVLEAQLEKTTVHPLLQHEDFKDFGILIEKSRKDILDDKLNLKREKEKLIKEREKVHGETLDVERKKKELKELSLVFLSNVTESIMTSPGCQMAAPQWSVGSASYTLPPTGKTDFGPGVIIGPLVYKSTSRPGSRDHSLNRRRSANYSQSRDGSLSPTSASSLMYNASASRSLPRLSQLKRNSLKVRSGDFSCLKPERGSSVVSSDSELDGGLNHKDNNNTHHNKFISSSDEL